MIKIILQPDSQGTNNVLENEQINPYSVFYFSTRKNYHGIKLLLGTVMKLLAFICELAVRPFQINLKGVKKSQAGFAMPLAIGASMMAGMGVVYVSNRVDEAEELINRQMISQAAATIHEKVKMTAQSVSAIKRTSESSNDLDACVDDFNAANCNRAARTIRFTAQNISNAIDRCESTDRSISRNCLNGVDGDVFGNLFPEQSIRPSQLRTILSSSAGNAMELRDSKGETVTGAYNRYGGKCDYRRQIESDGKGKDGCGRVIVRTKFGIRCDGPGGACVSREGDNNVQAVAQVVVFYAVYIRQGDNPANYKWTPSSMGVAEPALVMCEKGKYLSNLTAGIGSLGIECKSFDYKAQGPSDAERKKWKGDQGDKGPRGPRGRPGSNGRRL